MTPPVTARPEFWYMAWNLGLVCFAVVAVAVVAYVVVARPIVSAIDRQTAKIVRGGQ